MRMLFRDHYLSDLIGFQYPQMGAGDAAGAFSGADPRERRRAATRWCPSFSTAKMRGNGMKPNGRPFLRELYRRISEDPRAGSR